MNKGRPELGDPQPIREGIRLPRKRPSPAANPPVETGSLKGRPELREPERVRTSDPDPSQESSRNCLLG